MFGRKRADLLAAPRYPRRWRRKPAVNISLEQIQDRVDQLKGVTPAGVAALDQIARAVRDLSAGFGVRMDDAREVWAVLVGICVLDSGVGMSDIDAEAREEVGLFAAACVQSLLPLVGGAK